jgi:glycosyltransferase involved in cell wall biosynthesis
MKLSLVIPVLDSHEIVRRQLLHFERIGLPVDTELILVDDGSDPPIATRQCRVPVIIHRTHDTRPWTWALARNAGARIASGEYLLMFDLDHIVTRELLDFVHGFGGHKVQFLREMAVLDEEGRFTQDRDVLERYGLPRKNGLQVGPLPNNFAMRRDLFWELGGYREDLVERAYPQGEDRLWKKTWYEYQRRSGNQADRHRPTIYVFPVGKLVGDVDYNPQGLFHGLTRKTNRNHWYQEQKRSGNVTS